MHSMGFCSVLVGFIVSLGGGCIVCFGGDFCVSVLVVFFFFLVRHLYDLKGTWELERCLKSNGYKKNY